MQVQTEQALDYLCQHNVMKEYWSQETYFLKLLEFFEAQGEEALQALAGFHVWITDSIDDPEKRQQLLLTTFRHDLNGTEEETMNPRSSAYLKFWLDRE